MVTMTLNELLEQKRLYHEQFPGDPASMPRGVYQAYRNLLREIRAAADRNQAALPGMDMTPVPPVGQDMMQL